MTKSKKPIKKSVKIAKNYYKQLDEAIAEYEEYKATPQHSILWISDRIAWCLHYKHITASEAEAFADRVTAIIEDMGCYSKYGALI